MEERHGWLPCSQVAERTVSRVSRDEADWKPPFTGLWRDREVKAGVAPSGMSERKVAKRREWSIQRRLIACSES